MPAISTAPSATHHFQRDGGAAVVGSTRAGTRPLGVSTGEGLKIADISFNYAMSTG